MSAPLVPAEVDLRDFQYMELDVRVLRDSRFAAQVSGDAFRAGVLLWCAAWHQVPCSSLPDDDIELANLAGYGRFFEEWKKVKSEALIGFVKCADGRLYHDMVAQKAMSAWMARLRHHYDKARDRLRKLNKARAAEKKDLVPELSFDQWNVARLSGGIPMERAEVSAGIPDDSGGKQPPVLKLAAGIPAENALKWNGEGTEQKGNGDSKEEKKKPQLPLCGLKAWIGLRQPGEAAVPADDPVFEYAAEIGLPREFLQLAWREFRARYTLPGAKRYRDWRAVFRKSVRENWLKLWYLNEGQYQLTTVGQQAQRLHNGKEAA